MDSQHLGNVLVLLVVAGLAFAFAATEQPYAAIAVTVLGGMLAASMAERPVR